MKSIVFLCCLVAAALAAPSYRQNDQPVESGLVSYQSVNPGDGTYSFEYETADGQKRKEQGVRLDSNDPNSPIVVSGFYSYLVDGKEYVVNYKADQNGYQVLDNANNNYRY